jgi:hypothetical protein
MKIPKFEKRFKLALIDPIVELAKKLFQEGFTESDVFENLKQYPCLPEPYALQLRNAIRDLEIQRRYEWCDEQQNFEDRLKST